MPQGPRVSLHLKKTATINRFCVSDAQCHSEGQQAADKERDGETECMALLVCNF